MKEVVLRIIIISKHMKTTEKIMLLHRNPQRDFEINPQRVTANIRKEIHREDVE